MFTKMLLTDLHSDSSDVYIYKIDSSERSTTMFCCPK